MSKLTNFCIRKREKKVWGFISVSSRYLSIVIYVLVTTQKYRCVYVHIITCCTSATAGMGMRLNMLLMRGVEWDTIA